MAANKLSYKQRVIELEDALSRAERRGDTLKEATFHSHQLIESATKKLAIEEAKVVSLIEQKIELMGKVTELEIALDELKQENRRLEKEVPYSENMSELGLRRNEDNIWEREDSSSRLKKAFGDLKDALKGFVKS